MIDDVDKSKLVYKLNLNRGIKKDIYARLPSNSLLWHIFERLEMIHDYDWDGLSFRDLKNLSIELNDLIEYLQEFQDINDDFTFTLGFDPGDSRGEITIENKRPESIGEYKSRLVKLKNKYKDDPVVLSLIKEVHEKLWDRNNFPKEIEKIDPSIENIKDRSI